MPEAMNDNSIQAVPQPDKDVFRTDFDLNRSLPEPLTALDAISRNFYWSWQPEGTALFRDLDPVPWDKCSQSPRLLLERISRLRLWQKACEADYLGRLEAFDAQFKTYLSDTTELFPLS